MESALLRIESTLRTYPVDDSKDRADASKDRFYPSEDRIEASKDRIDSKFCRSNRNLFGLKAVPTSPPIATKKTLAG